MEKMVITSGENKVNVDTGLTGNGTSENPLQYTGEIQHSDKRSLLWESTGNDYNTNIELSETIHHFDKVMIYGSGLEAADTMHVSKNVYTVQPNLINGCDVWGYSPWTTAFQANYILGADLKLSGNSGHIGSSYCWGIGSKNATWAASKWTGTEAPKMLMPWKIFGLGRHPIYNFYGLDSDGGSVASNIPSGYSGDTATLTVTPSGDEWKCSALNITGAELTGNDFMFENSNVTAQAEFEHSRDLTLVNSDHGVLSADKMSGFSGDVVTVDATTDEGWYLSAIALTGAEATGFKFMFTGSDVTALGEYTDVGFPITYLSDEHVSVTGDTTIFIPGQSGITLQTGYDTYYRISGYEVENGEIVDGVLIPTGPCTIKAIEKVNYFTATGNFEKGSNITKTQANPWYVTMYILHQSHTGDIPTSWYATSNRWKPNNISSYNINIHGAMQFSCTSQGDRKNGGKTACIFAGSNVYQTKTYGNEYNVTNTYTANQSLSTQDVYYGVSAKLLCSNYRNRSYYTVNYIANGTTGTWTATGIAP